MAEKDNYISRKMDKGTINISEEVVASLVKSAVAETEGVAELSNIVSLGTEDGGARLSIRNVKVRFREDAIIADAAITVAYGNNIVDVARKAQENALSILQSSAGFDHVTVNIHVAGVAF
jgi:uncharacterized alkaline shock family protein YloU